MVQTEFVTSLLYYELTFYAISFVSSGVVMLLGALTYISVFGAKHGKR